MGTRVSIESATLARAHMAAQVRSAGVAQAALSVGYKRAMSPADIRGSFATFSHFAVPVMSLSRTKGNALARSYYASARELAGVTDPPPSFAVMPLSTEQAMTSLFVTGPVSALRMIREGQDPEEALSLSTDSMLGAAKRLILNGSRGTILDLTRRDRRSGRWQRVGDGATCDFCEMLIGRGAVYSEESADFQTHDHCGCSAEPLF